MTGDRALEFVDTNVLVYAHDPSAGHKHAIAKQLVEDLWNSGLGALSVQVLQEFFVVLTRKVARPLKADVAIKLIADLGQWAVHSPNAQDVAAAATLHASKSISFWDAMIVWSAAQLECARLWTEDLQDGFKYAGLKIQNPFGKTPRA